MLKMIPLSVITDIKSIRLYIRKYVNDHSNTKWFIMNIIWFYCIILFILDYI